MHPASKASIQLKESTLDSMSIQTAASRAFVEHPVEVAVTGSSTKTVCRRCGHGRILALHLFSNCSAST